MIKHTLRVCLFENHDRNLALQRIKQWWNDLGYSITKSGRFEGDAYDIKSYDSGEPSEPGTDLHEIMLVALGKKPIAMVYGCEDFDTDRGKLIELAKDAGVQFIEFPYGTVDDFKSAAFYPKNRDFFDAILKYGRDSDRIETEQGFPVRAAVEGLLLGYDIDDIKYFGKLAGGSGVQTGPEIAPSIRLYVPDDSSYNSEFYDDEYSEAHALALAWIKKNAPTVYRKL